MASYPIGRLSDKMPRVFVLMFGCFCLILSDILLCFGSNITVIFCGIAVWGIQIGVTQSMFVAMIADYVPEDLRGTGFGLFYLFSAGSIFIAGLYGGYISHHYSISTMYLCSGAIACCAIIALIIVYKMVLSKKSSPCEEKRILTVCKTSKSPRLVLPLGKKSKNKSAILTLTRAK